MCVKEVRSSEKEDSVIRSYEVEITIEERKSGRNYFQLPNGKRYYIDSDSGEVYLAENQDEN